jgi:hypothetical protein
MKILEPVFIEVIEKLLHNKVDFILIGGYAVNYYGYGRYTGDIDFWLRPSAANKEKFLTVFNELCNNTNDVEKIRALNFEDAQVISIGEPPLQIDFITKVNLVSFDEAWEKRVFFPLKKFQLPVVYYHHLITMKFNTGRPKDKLDLEQLQKINQGKKK